MSDRLTLANAIEDAGIERAKAERVAMYYEASQSITQDDTPAPHTSWQSSDLIRGLALPSKSTPPISGTYADGRREPAVIGRPQAGTP
jgi:hypothetical protein